MIAVRFREFGPPSVLRAEETADPRPGPGQLLVRVVAAGVTYVDTQIRAGRPPWSGGLPPLPMMPGNGVEGTVVEVGPQVHSSLIGRRVAGPTGGSGGYAELAIVRADEAIIVPDELAEGHAVALLADGRTALALIRAIAPSHTDRVLVTAAAGGVGGLLIQLARAAGVKSVIAVASDERKLSHARALGADVAVDYTRPGWDHQVGPVDVVFDGVGGVIGRTAFELTAPRARLALFGMSSGSYTEFQPAELVSRGVQAIGGVQLGPAPDNRMLSKHAIAAAAAGDLIATVGQTFPLDRAADAHTAMESRTALGKTLLLCGTHATMEAASA